MAYSLTRSTLMTAKHLHNLFRTFNKTLSASERPLIANNKLVQPQQNQMALCFKNQDSNLPFLHLPNPILRWVLISISNDILSK